MSSTTMALSPIASNTSPLHGENGTTDHLNAFFSQFTHFGSYDPSGPVTDEFNRMCDEYGWPKCSQEKQNARELFQDALTQDFNDAYGTDVNSTASWQTLCRTLNITPIPTELEECRTTVKQTHVNLVDLVDTRRTGQPVTVYDSEDELRAYTIFTRKFFPRESAYAGGLLRYLLRKILSPSNDAPRPTRHGKENAVGRVIGGGIKKRGSGRSRSHRGRNRR
ncbi:hypothetical protein BD410DRAFT_636858 [Rickenella mellea]|uniref:Uncharacterized protein n=1 Tax=Rickenella mellea TaxID=50990 RepID=A0A4Y7QDD5_9AGAM|nr:hypothetical protein BD410DRAFT_636858 [Rickenella mellea]